MQDYYKDDYKDDYRNDYRNDYRKENHRDFKDQKYKRKHRDNYENTYEDRYNKDNHRNSYKAKDRNKNKDQHRDDSYDKIRDMSKGKGCSYDDRKDDSFKTKLERVYKILQLMSQENEMTIGFMLIDSENPGNILDSIHSQADVDHLIAERIDYAKSHKAEELTKDPLDNISNTSSQSNVNPVNYESIDLDIGLTQHLQENVESVQSISVPTKIIEGEVDDYSMQHSVTSPHEENIQDVDIYDMVKMPDIPTRIADDQVIEEFMLEGEEIDFQGIDECKTVKLQDVPIEVANEQELGECMQEEVVSDITLPEVYKVDEKLHTDVKLEIPIIKSEEKCIVQDEPKLVQDKILICDTSTPLQTNAQAQPMTEPKVLLPGRVLQSKIIPITHAGRRENLRCELVRKENPTYTDSICRPPSKPPDKQNSLGEINKKIPLYINPKYRPPPKPPNIQNTKGERVWVLKNESLLYTVSDYRPPRKSPDIPRLSRILLDLEKDPK